MPRQQITFNPILQSHTPPSPDSIPTATITVEHQRRNVHVHWTTADRGCPGWVQLGIDVTVAELRSMLTDAETEAEKAAADASGLGEFIKDDHPFRIMSDVLSRSEMNRLVTTARRSRDGSYGKDA